MQKKKNKNKKKTFVGPDITLIMNSPEKAGA